MMIRINKFQLLLVANILCAKFTFAQLDENRIDLKSVIQEATIQLKRDSSNFFYYEVRANAFFELGKFEEALIDINKVINYHDPSFDNYYNKGVILDRLKRYEEAVLTFNKAIAVSESFDVYFARGLVFYEMRQFKNAIQDFDKALEIDSNNASAYNHRGLCFIELYQYPKAIVDFGTAINIDNKETMYFSNRGYAYLKDQHIEAAKLDLNYSLELDSTNYYGYYYLYLLYDKNGNKELAKEYLIKAKEYEN